jgi:hypothetical protein
MISLFLRVLSYTPISILIRKIGKQRSRKFASTQGREIEISYSPRVNSELVKLFEHYGSDKSIPVHSKTGNHNYADIYEILFHGIRDTSFTLFECGIGTTNPSILNNMGVNGKPGASLRAWRDYFPQARILGADIDRSIIFSEERIDTAYVDQTDSDSIKNMWDSFGSPNVKIIIDDGLHNFQAGVSLFENSFHKLEDGFYIIEDVSYENLEPFKRYFEGVGVEASIIRLLTPGISSFSNNNLVVIRR